MFKTAIRLLLGAWGALSLIFLNLDFFMPMRLQTHVMLENIFAVIAFTGAPAGLISLLAFKPKESGMREIGLWALGIPLFAAIAVPVFYLDRMSLPELYPLLVLYVMVAGALAMLATAIKSDWDYRGTDAMRSPAHVP